MSDQIRINGNALSWGSIYLKLGDERYTGFTKLSYGDARERVKGYGMSKHHAPRLRTRGKYTVEPVKLTGPKATIQQLREDLAAKSPNGISYGDIEFEGVAQYIDTGDAPQFVELERLVFAKQASNEEENPDPLMEDIELDCMLVRRNGLVLFDSSEGSP